MRIIAGEFYDVQEGLKKASELEKALFDELGNNLDKALGNIREAEEQLYRDLSREDWEKGKEDRDKLQAKINADIHTRKTFLYAAIVLAVLFPSFSFASSVISGMESTVLVLISNILALLSCVLTAFLLACLLVIFIYSLSISSKKSLLRPSRPQRRIFDYVDTDPSNMIALFSKLVSYLSKAQNPLHGNNNYGLQGEDRLVQRLGMMLNDDYICVRGAMVDTKLDADVILVGPSGIWILESKFIAGRIIKDHYGWRREKFYHKIGGALTQQNNLLDNVESQWKREKEAVVRALRNHNLNPRQIPVNKIKGGVVFTHHNSALLLSVPASIEVGNLDRWCETISGEQENTVLTEQQVRDAVSAILQYARKFNPDSRSALTEAEVRYHHKREYLLAFIDRNLPHETNETVHSGVN